MMYSRHRATPPQSGHSTPNRTRHGSKTPTQGFYPQPQQQRQNQYQRQQQAYQHFQQHQQQDYHHYQPQHHHQQQQLNKNNETSSNDVIFYKHLNAQSSPSTYYNMGTSLGSYRQGGGGYNIVEHLPPKPPTHNQRQVQGSSFSTPNFGNRGRGDATAPPDHTCPSPNQGAVRGGSGQTPPPPQSQLSYPVNSTESRSELPLNLPTSSSTSQQENVVHRPPSGKQSGTSIKRGFVFIFIAFCSPKSMC